MKLPVWPKNDRDIIDEDGRNVCFANTTADRDYIVQVINSHEKFKTALEIISDLETRRSKTGIGYDKVTHELVKDALEAEKP